VRGVRVSTLVCRSNAQNLTSGRKSNVVGRINNRASRCFNRRYLLPDKCPFKTGIGTFEVQTNAVMRMVADLEDDCMVLGSTTTGTSGRPESPYYKDQVPAYLAGTGHPYWRCDAEIEAHKSSEVLLCPSDRSDLPAIRYQQSERQRKIETRYDKAVGQPPREGGNRHEPIQI